MKTGLKLSAALAAIMLAGGLVACDKIKAPAQQEQAAVETEGPRFGDWGVDLTQVDETVKPGDDFNRYANGKWLDSFEIPADLSRYTMFTLLTLEAEDDIRKIVEDLSARKSAPGTLEQQVGDFYKSWMNVERLDELGATPLKPHLDAFFAIESHEDLMKALYAANLYGDTPFSVGILPDPADTTRYIAFVGQSGLGMPDRDYYLKQDERFAQYRAAYREYVTKLLSLAGFENAGTRADAIIALETEIAKVHWTQEDSRDIQKIYNPMNVDQLAELAPDVDWKTVFGDLGLTGVDTFVVAQTTAIADGARLLAAAPIETARDYLAFHFIDKQANNLSSEFDKASFEFFGHTLQGAEEQRERWKRGVQQINDGLGEAVGQVYVQRHFPTAYKEKMDGLVANLVAALKVRLENNEWMDEPTREQALLKLSTFEAKIGYTTKWTDYGPLAIDPESLLENALAIAKFQWQDQLKRLGGPVDREIWDYPPQTVNASYDPLLNQITFPAGILQPPFFDPKADPAVNYGGIGAVIGHEIGHGFDDQGRRFDELGRIRDWWTLTADARFKAKTDALGAQYDSYEPVTGLHINGQLTMGENIGDLGGLQMAYAAYHRYLDECCGGEAPVIDGLTGDQRFFLGWAQVWRATAREDELRRRLVTDPHSPPEYRINGIVRNLDAWYEAFGVSEGDALYLPPEDRVRIW